MVSFIAIHHATGQPVMPIDNENLMVTHGPYLQNVTTTGATVIWTTNKPALPGIILSGGKYENRLFRSSHDGIIDAGGTLHKIRIEGLEPGTTYSYRLSSIQIMKYQAYKVYYGDTLVQRAESFSTVPLKTDRVAFTVINDVHENSGKLASYFRSGRPSEQDFYVFNGDMVDFLQDHSQLFNGFIDTSRKYFAASRPFYYIRGNHETRGFLARDLKGFFDYNGDRFYYSFDYGPAHFIVLDCGEDKPDNNRYYYGLADYDNYRLKELEWLKNEIRSDAFKKAGYRILLVHFPVIKQEKQGYGMKFLSDNFGPLLQEAGIDIAFSAHTHRNTFLEASQSGYGFPVLVNSNNSFVEVVADRNGISAVVKDIEGKQITGYKIK